MPSVKFDLKPLLAAVEYEFEYAPGLADKVSVDAFALQAKLLEHYKVTKDQDDAQTEPGAKALLDEAGFKSVPPGYAVHAVANAIIADVSARKKKYDQTLWPEKGSSAAPPDSLGAMFPSWPTGTG